MKIKLKVKDKPANNPGTWKLSTLTLKVEGDIGYIRELERKIMEVLK